MMYPVIRFATIFSTFAVCVPAWSAEVDFSRQIRPLLAKQCFSCHGPDTQEAGLALTTFEKATLPLESGDSAIVPSDPDRSELLRRITSDDPSVRMPPEGAGLTPAQAQLIRDWISSGAEYKEHWAFRPLERPDVPETKMDWPITNGIDAFVVKQWEKAGLQPTKFADPRSLVRRLYFDCLGVPPDEASVEAFAKSPTEAAYRSLVDDLLADPRYGERMARDWLDVVRYAETNSFERDGPKPNAWKYRDYVIRSFNEDKPYNRFIAEQIAGDELPDRNVDTLTATGFFRLGIWDDEPADPALARFDEYDDVVTTIGQGILGLTMNCARCHEHKIDPIPQKDYYQLVAFIRDVTSYAARGDQKTNSQIDVSDATIKSQHADLKQRIHDNQIAMRDLEEQAISKMSSEDQVAAKSPDRSKVLKERLQSTLAPAEWDRYNQLRDEIESSRKEIENLPIDYRLGLAKCEPNPPETNVLMRGSPQSPGDVVRPAFLTLFKQDPPEIPPSNNSNTAGRRTVLANWLGANDNRLTSRVIVNRLWQHHFGRGIVRSANNFGQMGDAPTHPELLDYLATQLVDEGWHLKAIHRLMLLSSTYRLSSVAEPKWIQKDPTNDYFARFNPRRLSAEEIRDATLVATGKMNWTMYGPSIYPDVSDAVKAGQSVPGSGWGTSSPTDQSRRSIYIYIKRSLVPPELSVFDFPDTDTSCEARFLTTQPAQALNMLNGDFVQKQATLLSQRIEKELPAGTGLDQKIAKLVSIAFSRPCSPDDIQRAKQRIASLQSKFSLSEEKAFREYCLVILNSNEFIYVD